MVTRYSSDVVRHNVCFKGGIATIPVTPNKEMIELERQATNLRAEADKLMNKHYDIGQCIAESIFTAKHPNY
jgi:hypothetical protein